MSRFSTSLLLTTGLLLTTMLATISTRLHAEPNSPQHLDIHTQTVTPQPQVVPTTNLESVGTSNSQSLPTKPILNSNAPSETSIPTPTKPVNGANLAPSNTPTTPTTPTTKPAVAATSQPPVESVINIVLKLKEKRLYVYRGDKLITKYPVAIGKKGWETPTGEWQVMEKIKNPAWKSFKTGEVFAAGRENPLGARWIGFWTDGQDVIGFHGTPNVNSIGTAASHGCVRMYNRDVKALFPLVKVGTTVKVVNE
jgi:lipoprotein-anchoring transpeptidase ErfK/SrfK